MKGPCSAVLQLGPFCRVHASGSVSSLACLTLVMLISIPPSGPPPQKISLHLAHLAKYCSNVFLISPLSAPPIFLSLLINMFSNFTCSLFFLFYYSTSSGCKNGHCWELHSMGSKSSSWMCLWPPLPWLEQISRKHTLYNELWFPLQETTGTTSPLLNRSWSRFMSGRHWFI